MEEKEPDENVGLFFFNQDIIIKWLTLINGFHRNNNRCPAQTKINMIAQVFAKLRK